MITYTAEKNKRDNNKFTFFTERIEKHIPTRMRIIVGKEIATIDGYVPCDMFFICLHTTGTSPLHPVALVHIFILIFFQHSAGIYCTQTARTNAFFIAAFSKRTVLIDGAERPATGAGAFFHGKRNSHLLMIKFSGLFAQYVIVFFCVAIYVTHLPQS